MSEEASLSDFDSGERAEPDTADEDSPTNWTEARIIDLCEMGGGSTPKKGNSDFWDDGEILWTTPKDFKGPRLEDTEDKITEEGANASTSKVYQPGTTLLVVRSGVLRHTLPVAMVERPTTVNQDLKALNPDREQVNSEYFFQALSGLSEDIRGSCKKTGTTVESIQTNVLEQYSLPVPSLEEQRKIATVLYTVDQAIQKTEEIISQLVRVKQGSYQNLFSDGYESHSKFKPTKYGEIPYEWNVSKLSEMTIQIQAGGTPDTDVAEYYGGEIPWVKTGELSQYRVTETEQSITETGLDESTARLFSPGTILIAMYGATTGEVSLLEIEAATNQACCGVLTTDKMLSEFLFHQLNYLSDYLVSLSAGSGQQNISKGIIEKFDIIVPPVREQESILDVLNGIDESIAKCEGTKKQLQFLKQGLMQDLLSGAVRTDDVDIAVLDDVLAHG